jgi:hypothetical protein
MSFLAPAAFWFALTLPVVVLFYLLKRKRTVKLTSSTVLWQRFLAETQASSPLQKLRHSWLLILQLLLLALVVFALSRPYFSGQRKGGRLLVVILDVSASMQSRDVAPSRFEVARSEALQLVDSLQDSDQMVVLSAGAGARVLQSATSEKANLRRVLKEAVKTDSTTDVGEALKMAESLTRDNAAAEVHLFSDGAAAGLADLENRGLQLVYHRVGEVGRNAGLVQMELRPNPENPAQRAVFVAVMNAAAEPRTAEVQLWFNDSFVESKPISMGPTNTVPVIFVAEQLVDGVFEARLTGEDDLAADDRAWLVSELPKPLRVLMVSRGNRFLERALRTSPLVRLTVVGNLLDSKPDADLLVLDGVEPAVWPELNVLALQVFKTNWFSMMGEVESPAIVDWKTSHPLMRFVGLDNVMVTRSRVIADPEWGDRVVDSTQTPLVVAGEFGKQRIVWLGFDVLESTWPLRVSFPIFIANALDWLNPGAVRAAQQQIKVGAPFRLALDEAVEGAELQMPDGEKVQLELDRDLPELVVGDTAAAGIYRLRFGTNEVKFAVNLLDSSETATEPHEALDMGRFGEVEASTIRPASVEVWRWIAAAALGVLMLEWWFYHRRTA